MVASYVSNAARRRALRSDRIVALHHHLRTRLKAEMKTRNNAEEARTGPTRCPEQVGIFALVGMHQFAIGGDDVHAEDAAAGRPPQARVPAEAALQQKATEAHGHAMAGRKEQAIGKQRAIEIGTFQTRLDCRSTRAHVD
jgi:hypothetical protein